MASTNKTTHYELSQYVGSDKPTYLGDYNSDMNKIDIAINTAKTTADTASTVATNAASAASNAQTTADTAVTNAASAQTTANGAVSSIGTLANLETSEKTNLVGAINEVVNNVENSETISTVKSYSCSYSDSRYKLKHEHVERLIYSGRVGNNVPAQINTSWADLGVFSELVIELNNSNLNAFTNIIINYDLLSNGDNLYSGRKNIGCYNLAYDGANIQVPFIVPETDIGANTIKFTQLGTLEIVAIYVIE